MKIRSITYFCNPKYPLDEQVIRAGGEFLAQAKSAYEAAGFEVQTGRLATIPFPALLGEKGIADLPRLAERLEKLIGQINVGHASLGPALPGSPRSYKVIPEAIAASQNIFFDGVMADQSMGISLAAIEACAEVMVRSAPIDPNGFANLRFAALANVKAGAPFFPAAYHDQDRPAFAIATEAADLAVEAFSQGGTLEDGRRTLVSEIEQHARQLSRVAQALDCKFGGIDFSLGPFPAEDRSLGTAFERMGVPRLGLHGSLAAAAILTEAIDRADFPRTGFSGLMLPVLEDATLAKRAADGTLSVKDLLLYSAVCGTGLDTIPLPGDTSAEQIVPLLLDLSALALRLNKPLTARLMPVPGKKAGDPTSFDFGFFANSKVMPLDSLPLNSALGGHATFSIQSRPRP
ncbi:MAG TPA: DUF711 family protein [Anaerolineales bacterium]|nr:DUF711 family protein [Anaerolineales bacterium]